MFDFYGLFARFPAEAASIATSLGCFMAASEHRLHSASHHFGAT
jgi:hypothetical protein